MKITKKILQNIIKEEIAKVLAETPSTGSGPTIQRGVLEDAGTQSDFIDTDADHGDSSSSEDFRPPRVKQKEKEEKIRGAATTADVDSVRWTQTKAALDKINIRIGRIHALCTEIMRSVNIS